MLYRRVKDPGSRRSAKTRLAALGGSVAEYFGNGDKK